MLAAMYSETGQISKAVSIAQQALDLAVQHQNEALATELRGNLARYQSQAQQSPSTGPTNP